MIRIDDDVTARLAAALDQDERTFDHTALASLAPIVDALSTLDRPDAARVDDLRTRLEAALSAEVADALCDNALSPADVAARFARLRALLAAREALAG